MNKIEQRVLAWVNRIRTKYGEKPILALIPGLPTSNSYCVIAQSLDNSDIIVCVTVEPNSKLNEDGFGELVFDNPNAGREFCNSWGIARFSLSEDDDDPYAAPITVKLPKYVAEFANNFDNGKYPHLEA